MPAWLQAPAAGSNVMRRPSPFAALRPATAAMAAARKGARQSPFSRAATHDAGPGVAPLGAKMRAAPVSSLDAAADAAIAAEAARRAREAQTRPAPQPGLPAASQAPAEQGRMQGGQQAGQQSQQREQQRQAGSGSAGSSPGAVPVSKVALRQSAFSALSPTQAAASEDTAGQGASCSRLQAHLQLPAAVCTSKTAAKREVVPLPARCCPGYALHCRVPASHHQHYLLIWQAML